MFLKLTKILFLLQLMPLSRICYFATVIQVGGVGSDIYTNRAYYIGDGSDTYQEGWPNYLDKNTYALVSFNTPFYLMTLSCKDGYKATLLPKETSDPKAYSDTEESFTIEIKEKIKMSFQ